MMERRRQSGGRINVFGWLMSYADMATVLLAMFIVLSTLSKDQTGISLYNGTRSAAFSVVENKPTPSYLYRLAGEEGEENHSRSEEQPSVLDSDREPLSRFVNELRRQFPVECQRRQTGRVVIDLYEPLREEAPHLGARQQQIFEQIRPLLEREAFRVYLIVWAATPSPSAWLRAAVQSRQAADEFAATAHLPSAEAERMIPLAQPWRYRDIRRPILSFLLVKTAE
jgi:hypothetical protein